MNGKIIIITGPSAVGKSTIVNILLKKISHLKRVVNYTTRQPRGDEINSQNYHFITKTDFEKKIDQGFFLEHAKVYGKYYGNSLEEIIKIIETGDHALLTTDIMGVKNIQTIIPGQSISIFVYPDSLENLQKRLKTRGLPTEEYEKRWSKVKKELKQANICDYQVENKENQLPQTIQKIIKIIEKHQ